MSSYVSRIIALRGSVKTIKYSEFDENLVILSVLLDRISEDIVKDIRTESISMNNNNGGYKWYLAVRVLFKKLVIEEEEIETTAVFRSRTQTVLPANDDISTQYAECVEKVLESVSKFTREGSGWVQSSVVSVEVNLIKYKPLTGSSYIPTPPRFLNTKSIVNVKNLDDEKCFLWSILAGIYFVARNPNRVINYKRYESEVNMQGIDYPVAVKDINRFEKQNEQISVNVFGFEDDDVYPVRITKHKHRTHHVNLLLLITEEGIKHYCLVRSLSRMLHSVTSKGNNPSFYCNYCLQRFRDKSDPEEARKRLKEHEVLCTPHGAQKVLLPTGSDQIMRFTDYTKCHRVPYTVYADFESFLLPIHHCKREENVSHSDNIAHHVPCSFCYVIVDWTGNIVKGPVLYRGENDVAFTFLNTLQKDINEIDRDYFKPMHITEEEEHEFQNAILCHLCKEPFVKENIKDKVRNHCHLTGKYLGAAHYVCNLNYKVPRHIPVFFHNLRGYDSHYLVRAFGSFKNKKMVCIATTSERYISVTLGALRFLDSLQFMNSSLEKLVKNLVNKSTDNFKILCQYLNRGNMMLTDQERRHQFQLLLRKGIYPYEYMTDEKKFMETSLPAPEHFYNRLTDTAVDEGDYAHAQEVWTTFNMRTLGDYHDLYLTTDVLLLADVFENFRNMSLLYYEIDPCNVYSAPGLAWDAMLKMTRIKLELLSDINQYLFIENSIRGGTAMIPNRYARANNPYVSDYNKEIPHNYLLYLDCTNLYGTAMREKLPHSGFRWLERKEIDVLDINTFDEEDETGYVLEVDLIYPKELHDLHTDYPLAPERKTVSEKQLSPYCQRMRLMKTFNCSGERVEKLITSLNDKNNYVVHYKTLQLYLQLGLKLKTIHRVLSFRQSAWMKPFIDFNTEKRKAATNEFEKDFFKLMVNAVYGKSLENVRKRIDFRLVSNEKQLVKLSASPRLQHFFIYNKNLVGLTMKKQSIKLCRPLYVGFTVLDISKYVMYNFHYNFIVNKYKSRVQLCMTDTDSLLYNIQTDDVYTDIQNHLDLFDTSEYPVTHPCYSIKNKKRLGTFKDETKSKPILEFIGLRAKSYSLLMEEEDDNEKKKEKKVAKGVPRTAIEKQLTHEKYKKCLFLTSDNLTHRQGQMYTHAQVIRSENHQLYTREMVKLSLSPYDDKRYVLDNGQRTLAYGHYSIQEKTRRINNTSPTFHRTRSIIRFAPYPQRQSVIHYSSKIM